MGVVVVDTTINIEHRVFCSIPYPSHAVFAFPNRGSILRLPSMKAFTVSSVILDRRYDKLSV